MSTQTPFGVRIAGTGSAVPSKVLTNADLEGMIDTTSDWIVKRTGIHQRQILDQEKGETTLEIERRAITGALEAAGSAAAPPQVLAPLEKVLLLRDAKMLRFVPERFLATLADVEAAIADWL